MNKMLGMPFKEHHILHICTVHYTAVDSHNPYLIPINDENIANSGGFNQLPEIWFYNAAESSNQYSY